MMENGKAPREFNSWAMIYHQGWPVAVCPVEAVSGDTIQVVCGPLQFERHAPLVLQFTRHIEAGRIGTQMEGSVEGIDESGMRVRLEPTHG